MNQLSLICSLLPKNHVQKNTIIIDYGPPIISNDRLSISFRLPITSYCTNISENLNTILHMLESSINIRQRIVFINIHAISLQRLCQKETQK